MKRKTRNITFVGSSLTADDKDLTTMAKESKEEKTSLDVASFVEKGANVEL